MRRLFFLAVLSGCCACNQSNSGWRLVAGETVRAAPQEVALCEANEPGDRLVFGGRVLDYRGQPLSKAAVVAYNTDVGGLYNPPDSATRVPRIRGVAITDDAGRFRFKTIRPGAYPGQDIPAHIHMTVVAPAHRVRYLDYWFEGDPLITSDLRRRLDAGTVVVELARTPDGAWTFERDIRLEGN